jgi:hypothetical protein
MFATSFPAYPLTFTYVGEAEAPQGKADVVDAKGPNNFAIRFFVNQQTHLPIMVSWQGAPAGRGRPPGAAMGPGQAPAAGPGQGTPPGPGQPPPAGERGPPPSGERGAPPSGERGAPPAGARGAPPSGARGPGPGASPAPPVENRLYFADYRDVDGMMFPFRLRRAVGSETIEETTFDRFRINAKIDPRRFQTRK